MNLSFKIIPVLLLLICCNACVQTTRVKRPSANIDFWLTTADKTSLFQKTDAASFLSGLDTSGVVTIRIDTSRQFQSIDGFGFALTGGSAWLINQKLSVAQSDSLLRELFLSDHRNIGVSYLRISIGSSDLDNHVFTYNDLANGATDPTLSKFDMRHDQIDLIPVLKRIIALNPQVKIMGSPWSAPAWMKTNNSLKGGSLRPEYYNAYAQYFVKYIQGMAAEGIVIDAVTLQNEPENPKNNPSMIMTAAEQTIFVKNSLGPAFAKAGIKTKIIVFDHNCDHPNYPIDILNDKQANAYIDGSAFHLYLGKIEALQQTHDAHPDKNVYFTEQWTSPRGEFPGDLKWHTKNLIIGAPRNWSRNVLEWNLAADPHYNPHTSDGGCDSCQGAVTIGDAVTRNVSYYIIAHASKFVRPGSVRVASNMPDNLPNVAYVTPAGKKVLIVVNEHSKTKLFKIKSDKNETLAALPGGAVGTFVW